MKYILIAFIIFFSILPCYSEDDFSDIDYNFIESAFDGIKPVTDEQFNKTINQLTPQPVDNSFKGRLRTFFLGRKYGVQDAPKGQDQEIDYGGEAKAIYDLKNGVYYIKLLVSLKSSDGKVIQAGNYKIQEKSIDEQDYLVFYQGPNEYGKLRLRSFSDNDNNEKSVTYSRVDIVNDDIVRIVYSTIKETKCAYARIVK